jgi:histidyl-tRNA synthetase
MYRHERPQKGRYRQFHQYGVEALGYAGPDVDAEQIVMCARLWQRLGLQGIRLELNNIGSAEERARYRAALVQHLEKNLASLDEDAKRRMHTNPLRTLDSKNPMVKDVVASAPALTAFLGDASLAHFDGLKRPLKDQRIEFNLNRGWCAASTITI